MLQWRPRTRRSSSQWERSFARVLPGETGKANMVLGQQWRKHPTQCLPFYSGSFYIKVTSHRNMPVLTEDAFHTEIVKSFVLRTCADRHCPSHVTWKWRALTHGTEPRCLLSPWIHPVSQFLTILHALHPLWEGPSTACLNQNLFPCRYYAPCAFLDLLYPGAHVPQGHCPFRFTRVTPYYCPLQRYEKM